MDTETTLLNRSSTDGLDTFIQLCREESKEHFGSSAGRSENLCEAFSLLLAFGSAIEKVLAGSSSNLPGHLSLRAYVEELLRGEASQASHDRLRAYFSDAFALFTQTHLNTERALQTYAETLVEKFKPARIEARAVPKGLFKLLGVKEVAMWREYEKEFKHLNESALRELAQGRD